MPEVSTDNARRTTRRVRGLTPGRALAFLLLLLAAPVVAAEDGDPVDEPAREPASSGEPSLMRSIDIEVESVRRRFKELPLRLELGGFVDASYTWNLADPPRRRRANPLRVSDLDHDIPGIAYGKISLARALTDANQWDWGGRVEFGAGTMVADVFSVDEDFFHEEGYNLPQFYLEGQIPTPHEPIRIQVGRAAGWFGVESLDLPDNPNFSLSYFSNFTPFTNTGVSAGMDLFAGLRYTQWVVQGWDVVVDNNSAKSYGGQLAWSSDDETLWIAANWLAGAERDDNEADVRWLTELDLQWTPTRSTDIRAALHYGQEEGGATDGGLAKYGGAMLIARQGFVRVPAPRRRSATPRLRTREPSELEDTSYDRFAVAGRVTYWRDQGGARSGMDQALVSFTITLEVKVWRFAAVRAEFRRDHSTESFFPGHRGQGSRRTMETVTLDASLSF